MTRIVPQVPVPSRSPSPDVAPTPQPRRKAIAFVAAALVLLAAAAVVAVLVVRSSGDKTAATDGFVATLPTSLTACTTRTPLSTESAHAVCRGVDTYGRGAVTRVEVAAYRTTAAADATYAALNGCPNSRNGTWTGFASSGAMVFCGTDGGEGRLLWSYDTKLIVMQASGPHPQAWFRAAVAANALELR